MSEEHATDVDAVTGEFVAMARPDVVQVEIDGEIVLYDDSAKVMHRLSPTAGQVWRCLDGSGSLAEIAADIADVYQMDMEHVLSDIIATVGEFESAGLLEGVGDGPEAEEAEESSEPTGQEDLSDPFVHEPVSSCMDSSFPLGDAGSLTVKAGPYLLGVRFSTTELLDMARDVLAPSLVEGVLAPSNVSVKVTDSGAGRPLLYCYRSNMLVTRARSPQRALRATASLLSSYVPPKAGCVRLPALPVVRSGVMALFSPESWWVVARLAPQLRAEGWEVLDTPAVDLESDGHVLVAPLAVALDATALAGLPANRYEGARPAPGRYPVAAWIATANFGVDPLPESRAGRVAHVAAGVRDVDTHSARSVFETVAAMLEAAVWAVSPTMAANDLVAALRQAVP
jgi:hypothetical protein